VAAPPPDPARLARVHGFRPDQVGFLLRDLADGRVLAAHNAESAFIPASVTKLATAAAALEILGGAHRFETRVRVHGGLANGRLDGDLILEGGGDPLLGADGLLALCEDLRHAGLRRVSGRFLLDDRRYPRQRAIADTQPPDATYNPGVSALALDFNRIRVLWEPAGERLRGRTLPAVPSVAVAQRRDPNAPRRGWRAEIRDGTTLWRAAPDLASRGEDWLPVKRPAAVTGALFRQLCARTGLDLPPPVPVQATGDPDTRALPVLARHAGRPVADIAKAMLAYSNNLVAELLGLAAAQHLTGRRLSLAESAEVLRRWWAARLPEDAGLFKVANHSGLDAGGQASPAWFAALLGEVRDRRYAVPGGDRRGLISLLPAAGWGSGLGERLRDPASAFHVWAKTGTMAYASGLAGYLLGAEGRRYAFAVLVTDAEARRAYDAAANKRAPARQARRAGWRDRAKALEADLLRGWTQALSVPCPWTLDRVCENRHAAQQHKRTP